MKAFTTFLHFGSIFSNSTYIATSRALPNDINTNTPMRQI